MSVVTSMRFKEMMELVNQLPESPIKSQLLTKMQSFAADLPPIPTTQATPQATTTPAQAPEEVMPEPSDEEAIEAYWQKCVPAMKNAWNRHPKYAGRKPEEIEADWTEHEPEMRSQFRTHPEIRRFARDYARENRRKPKTQQVVPQTPPAHESLTDPHRHILARLHENSQP